MRPDADHFPFYQKYTPVLMFHTGLHEQYHRPSDKANLINSDGMQQVMRLVFRVVYDEAEADRVTSFRASASQEKEATKKVLVDRLPPLPQHPLRVGITWRVDDAEPGVAIITRVVPDSPAAKAGLTPEDRICGIDGRDFRDDSDTRKPAQDPSRPDTALGGTGRQAPHGRDSFSGRRPPARCMTHRDGADENSVIWVMWGQ